MDGLRPYNFREGGKAERLVRYGKAAMPPLMKRVAELSGGSVLAPREQATLLALRIVADEDAQRAGGSPRTVPALDPKKDPGGELLRWWAQEEDAFMTGDDWELPPILGGRAR